MAEDGTDEDAPEALQDEIIRLGLERAAQREREQERAAAASAATHAIEEAYDIPEPEARAIAAEAEAELVNRKVAQSEQKTGAIVSLVLAIGLIGGGAYLFVEHDPDAPEYEAGISSAMSKAKAPVDALERLDLVDGARLCVWARWQRLTEGRHEYRTVFRDGAGDVVYERPGPFETPGGTKMTWACYQPKVNLDRPGIWSFTVWFDEHEAFSLTLPVGVEAPAASPG
jgi:hypothetical protein